MNEEQHEQFRSQVERLVAAGKLTAEEAAELLDGLEGDAPGEPLGLAPLTAATDTPPDLHLSVTGYALHIVQDSAAPQPQLHVSEPGRVELTVTPQGWQVREVEDTARQSWRNVRAVLTLPFAPRHVQAEVHGGQVTLPDLGGGLQVTLHGGNVRAAGTASLSARTQGGNLSVGAVAGGTDLTVHGGNVSVAGSAALSARIHGGNLRWNGQLVAGEHQLKLHGGNAMLALHPASSLRVDARVSGGLFAADFPIRKDGPFGSARYQGQLGDGAALLACQVAGGHIRLVTA